MNFHWPTLDATRKLSAEEAAEFAARMAELAKAGLPLGEGLRALAGELSGRRLPHLLHALADRLDAGVDLAEAMESVGGRLPAHLRGLVLVGLRSGRLAEVLEEYVDLQRSQAELRRRVWLSLVYPFMLLAMLTAMMVITGTSLVPSFEKIFKDFGTELPAMTSFVILSSLPAMWGTLALLILFAAIPLSLVAAPRIRWLWPLLHGIPMIGPLLRWSNAAQFARLMGLMLDEQAPLPDALRLTADGLRDADLAWGCRRVAEDVEQGRALFESMATRPQFPESMIPVVEWGQRAPALPDAFRAAAEMFEGRVRSQGSLLEAILLPVMFLWIIGYVGTFVVAMFLPLISLIQHLS